MNMKKIKKFLIVDFSKRLTLGDQLKIMFEILFISWLLFTFLYIFVLIRGNSKHDTPSYAEVSQVQQESKIPQTQNSVQQESEQASVQPSEISESSPQQTESGIFKETEQVHLKPDKLHKGELILVNKQYPCYTDGEEAVSMMELKTDSYMVTDYNVSLNGSIIEDFNSWLDDFAEIYGESEVMVACGYRSSENQQELFDNEVDEVGEEEAEKWVARPGYSEHQTGYVIDFTLYNDSEQNSIKYDGTDIYEWINKNCYKYGFILRYPEGKEDITGYSYEPWHFRYTGNAAAYYISENGLTLEEYIDLVKQYSIENPLFIDAGGEKKWYVYYVPANEEGETEVTVPKNSRYQISGDNFSGFIVTADVDIKG